METIDISDMTTAELNGLLDASTAPVMTRLAFDRHDLRTLAVALESYIDGRRAAHAQHSDGDDELSRALAAVAAHSAGAASVLLCRIEAAIDATR
jgi:hypothetical protein